MKVIGVNIGTPVGTQGVRAIATYVLNITSSREEEALVSVFHHNEEHACHVVGVTIDSLVLWHPIDATLCNISIIE